jgi:hypothetical protein
MKHRCARVPGCLLLLPLLALSACGSGYGPPHGMAPPQMNARAAVPGKAAGKQLFLSLAASPYRGQSVYQPAPPPSPRPPHGDFQADPSPAPPRIQGPLGFLNFDPKYQADNAWASPADDVHSALVIDTGGQSGRFEADMSGANSRVPTARIHLSGAFDCSRRASAVGTYGTTRGTASRVPSPPTA